MPICVQQVLSFSYICDLNLKLAEDAIWFQCISKTLQPLLRK